MMASTWTLSRWKRFETGGHLEATYQDMLRFNRVVQYLAQFLPRAVDYTVPLTGMCSNNCDFVWTNLQDKCFNEIKNIIAKAPILKPVDRRTKVPIWVLSDALASGVGAWYG